MKRIVLLGCAFAMVACGGKKKSYDSLVGPDQPSVDQMETANDAVAVPVGSAGTEKHKPSHG